MPIARRSRRPAAIAAVIDRIRVRVGNGLTGAVLLGLPIVVAVVLLHTIDHDPALGVTFSNAPFSDEAWRALNARNLVLLGSWMTDDWAMHLVQAPLSVAQALIFSIAGVGLVQARLISVVATVAMTAVLLLGLKRPLGLAGAVAAAAGASFSALTLYYGRLALLEPSVALALSIAAIAAIRVDAGVVRRWAICCGLAAAVAVALKANALPSIVGIGVAVAVRSIREVDLRRFPLIVVAVMSIAGICWIALVAIPQPDALGDAVSVLPAAAIPHEAGAWIANLGRFVRSNDGVATLAWPLLVGAIVGFGLVVADRRSTPFPPTTPMPGPARVALVGGLWAAFGMIGVASFDYQPNRYFVAVLPGLALVVGAGVAVVARTSLVGRPLRAAAVVGIIILLVVPGFLVDAAWGAGTSHRALDGQVAVERILPVGVRVAGGYAPLFAMRVGVAAIVQYPDTTVNAGDLYATGVRWGVTETGPPPPWAADHPEAWAARKTWWCTTWGRANTEVCLVELP